MITSLLLTIPALILLNKYFPQLIGKPLKQGPIIRRLMDPSRGVANRFDGHW